MRLLILNILLPDWSLICVVPISIIRFTLFFSWFHHPIFFIGWINNIWMDFIIFVTDVHSGSSRTFSLIQVEWLTILSESHVAGFFLNSGWWWALICKLSKIQCILRPFIRIFRVLVSCGWRVTWLDMIVIFKGFYVYICLDWGHFRHVSAL